MVADHLARGQVFGGRGDGGGLVVVDRVARSDGLMLAFNAFRLQTGLSAEIRLEIHHIAGHMGHGATAHETQLMATFVFVLIPKRADNVIHYVHVLIQAAAVSARVRRQVIEAHRLFLFPVPYQKAIEKIRLHVCDRGAQAMRPGMGTRGSTPGAAPT